MNIPPFSFLDSPPTRGNRRSPSRSKVPVADDEVESDSKHTRASPTHSGSGAKKRKKKYITANLSGTKYEVSKYDKPLIL